MKLPLIANTKDTSKIWLSSVIELLLFLPVWILYKVYILPGTVEPMWMYVLPLMSLVGVFLRAHVTVRWKQLLLSLILGIGFGLLTGGISISAIPLTAAGSVCTYLGMTAHSRLFSFRMYWTGVALYFIATMVFHRISELQFSQSLLTVCGSLCLILALLISNKNHLHYSSLSGESAPLPQGLRRHNHLFVILFVITAAVLAAGAGKAIGLLLLNTVRTLLRWVTQLFSGSNEPPPQEIAPPPAMPQMPSAEASEPGILAWILNISFYIIAIAVAAFIAYHALRWLYRNTGGIWRRAIDALLTLLRKEQSPPENTTYVDEENSVFTWEKTRQSFKEFWRNKLSSGARRDRLDNNSGTREHTRWLYRQWLSSKQESGYEIKKHLTPQETGPDVLKWTDIQSRQRKRDKENSTNPDRLLELYDRVRYGEEEPSATDVAELKEQLKL